MTISDFISLVALVVSIFAYRAANKNTKLIMSQVELQINERISQTRNRIADISMQFPKIETGQKMNEQDLEIYRRVLNEAIEDNLNAYEEACSKYIDDGKVDKQRFKKNYRTEIRQLVENEKFARYFNPVTSRYKCILKVYNEWENFEK